MYCPEIFMEVILKTISFSQTELVQLDLKLLERSSFRKEKINLLRMFGHLGTSSGNLIFNFNDSYQQAQYDFFLQIRKEEVIKSLSQTTRQRENPNTLRNLLTLLQSPSKK
jgi:hypothetical protein